MALVVGLIVGVYAATLLSVSNTATIQFVPNVVGTGPVVSTTTCTSSTGTYAGAFSINWGNVATGTKASQFICVENMGTGDYTVSVTSNLPTADGTVSTPQSAQVVGPGAFLLVEFDWQVSPSAPQGSVTFSISFQ
jgi:hypothetical protein